MDRSSSWTNAGRNADYIPPSRVARMAVPSPRPPPGSTAEAVATARRADLGSGGSILPVLPSASPNATKRSSWTTPRTPNDTIEDEFHQSSSESFTPPPRRAEMVSIAASRRAEPVRQRSVSDGLFSSETEQAQLAYMEQMYGTINLLNAELESERRGRAALEATHPAMSDYISFEEDVQIPVSEFNEPPTGYHVSQTPVAPTYSPRKLRTMPSPPSHPPQTQHRVARPPVSPRSLVKDQDEELCATLGKNAELRIRSRDMERTVEKTELELELARKQIKMAERRAENREEKLRALLKEKLNWQKELKTTRAQVVEEKMRQVDLFREVEAAKRHFTAELEAVDQELRAAQEDNSQLRTHAAELKAQLNFQSRKMGEMARQAQDEKARFVAMIEDTRHRYREWKEGEAEALEAAHEQVVRNLKTEYELKMERHQDEKQKLRDKVNDLEVSMRLLQKDRTLSPLELSLRKATILGSKEHTGTIEAEQIESQSRILELENLLAHSQEYQSRQESIIKLSESTISRLMQEREVTALENLSLHPFGVEQQLPRNEELSYDSQLFASPGRRLSPPNTPSRNHPSPAMSIEPIIVRSPRSRSHTPRRADLEASIASAAQAQELKNTTSPPAREDNIEPSFREQSLLDELELLRKELAEAKAKAEELAASSPPCSSEHGTKAEFSVANMLEIHETSIEESAATCDTDIVPRASDTSLEIVESPTAVDSSTAAEITNTNGTTEVTAAHEAKEMEDEKESASEETTNDSIDKVPRESPIPLDEVSAQNVDEVRHSDSTVNYDIVCADKIDTASSPDVDTEQPNETKSDSCKILIETDSVDEPMETANSLAESDQEEVIEEANLLIFSKGHAEFATSGEVPDDINTQEADSVQLLIPDAVLNDNEDCPSDVQHGGNALLEGHFADIVPERAEDTSSAQDADALQSKVVGLTVEEVNSAPNDDICPDPEVNDEVSVVDNETKHSETVAIEEVVEDNSIVGAIEQQDESQDVVNECLDLKNEPAEKLAGSSELEGNVSQTVELALEDNDCEVYVVEDSDKVSSFERIASTQQESASNETECDILIEPADLPIIDGKAAGTSSTESRHGSTDVNNASELLNTAESGLVGCEDKILADDLGEVVRGVKQSESVEMDALGEESKQDDTDASCLLSGDDDLSGAEPPEQPAPEQLEHYEASLLVESDNEENLQTVVCLTHALEPTADASEEPLSCEVHESLAPQDDSVGNVLDSNNDSVEAETKIQRSALETTDEREFGCSESEARNIESGETFIGEIERIAGELELQEPSADAEADHKDNNPKANGLTEVTVEQLEFAIESTAEHFDGDKTSLSIVSNVEESPQDAVHDIPYEETTLCVQYSPVAGDSNMVEEIQQPHNPTNTDEGDILEVPTESAGLSARDANTPQDVIDVCEDIVQKILLESSSAALKSAGDALTRIEVELEATFSESAGFVKNDTECLDKVDTTPCVADPDNSLSCEADNEYALTTNTLCKAGDYEPAVVATDLLEEPVDLPVVEPQQHAISSSESEEVPVVSSSLESPQTIVANALVALVECTVISLVALRQEINEKASNTSSENVKELTSLRASSVAEKVVVDFTEEIDSKPSRDDSDTVDEFSKNTKEDIDEPVKSEQQTDSLIDATKPGIAPKYDVGVNAAEDEQSCVSLELFTHECSSETLIKNRVTDSGELVATVTKCFAANFVKGVMEMFDFDPSNSGNQESHDVVVDDIVSTLSSEYSAAIAAADNVVETCTTTPANDTIIEELVDVIPADTPNAAAENEIEDCVFRLTASESCNTVSCDEPLHDSSSMIEDHQLVQQNEPESRARTSQVDEAADMLPVDCEADDVHASSEKFILAIESPADTFTVARDFIDAVESEAMSAVILSLQDTRCSDSLQVEREHENEDHESNSTRSILESCSLSSEEQDESCNAAPECELLDDSVGQLQLADSESHERQSSSVLIEPASVEEIAQVVNEYVATIESEALANVSALRLTSGTLDGPEDGEFLSVEELVEPDLRPFSAEEIVSQMACHCASQAIAEVLIKLSETCVTESVNDDEGDSQQTKELQEILLFELSSAQNVVTREVPDSLEADEEVIGDISSMGTTRAEFSAVHTSHGPGVCAGLLPEPYFASPKAKDETPEVDTLCDANIPGELIEAEPVEFANESEVAEPVINPDEGTLLPSFGIVPDEGHAVDLQSEGYDKAVELLLAEIVDNVISSEDVTRSIGGDQIVTTGDYCDGVSRSSALKNSYVSIDQTSSSASVSDDTNATNALGIEPEAGGSSLSDCVEDLLSALGWNVESAKDDLQDDTSLMIEQVRDKDFDMDDSKPISDSKMLESKDTFVQEVTHDSVMIDTSSLDAIDSVMEEILDSICILVESDVESQIVSQTDNHVTPFESSNEVIEGTSTTEERTDNSTGLLKHALIEGDEVSTPQTEASETLGTVDEGAESPNKQSDIEPYAATSVDPSLEDLDVVRLTMENLLDRIPEISEVCCTCADDEAFTASLDKITETLKAVIEDTTELPQDEGSSLAAIPYEVKKVVTDICMSVEKKAAPKHRARSVHFACSTKEELPDRLNQARRSVILWQTPFDSALTKESVENSAKRRASKRRTSRRTLADLLAFPTELARFTTSDTTLLAYDAQHEQGQQPFSLLDYSILNINPDGRHIHLDDQDERVGSKIIGKRKTLMQELHSKNLALRQIPLFNYTPMRIKFQWSDFVVATPVRASNSNFGEGHISKSPVEPLRLLQKKGAKLPCGGYVIVSAFIRPLEDGNENLRVQIYDAERVEEFQFDFSEDIMKKYHLESSGMETQSLEFLRHLEFRRDEEAIIIKLPEKKAGDGSKAEGDRFQSERTMVGGGESKKREPKHSKRQARPASLPTMTGSQNSSEFSSSTLHDSSVSESPSEMPPSESLHAETTDSESSS